MSTRERAFSSKDIYKINIILNISMLIIDLPVGAYWRTTLTKQGILQPSQ
jgi:hypothetical protein